MNTQDPEDVSQHNLEWIQPNLLNEPMTDDPVQLFQPVSNDPVVEELQNVDFPITNESDNVRYHFFYKCNFFCCY